MEKQNTCHSTKYVHLLIVIVIFLGEAKRTPATAVLSGFSALASHLRIFSNGHESIARRVSSHVVL